jgi:hypothetical protein
VTPQGVEATKEITTMNTTKLASVAAAALLATVSVPAAAQAGGAAESINTGGCSGAAVWKMKVKPQNGGLQVEYEVDASRRGQQWHVNLFHSGHRIMSDVFTTRGPSGSFTIRTVEPNRAGRDWVSGRARRLGDGQTCRGGAGARF